MDTVALNVSPADLVIPGISSFSRAYCFNQKPGYCYCRGKDRDIDLTNGSEVKQRWDYITQLPHYMALEFWWIVYFKAELISLVLAVRICCKKWYVFERQAIKQSSVTHFQLRDDKQRHE